MTELQRLAGIVVSPSRTFEDINQRPTQVFPIALLLLFNLLGDFVVYQVFITEANFEQMARTEEQQIGTLRREREYWYLLPLIAVPVSVLALSIFFYIVLRMARAGATFA